MTDNPEHHQTLNGWLLTPAITLVNFLVNEMVIAGVTQRALVALQATPQLLSIAKDHVPKDNPDAQTAFQSLVQFTTTDAGFAKQEIHNGFATVLAHHAVATWAAVETTIERTLVSHVRKVNGAADTIQTSVPALKAEKIRTTTYKEAKNTLRLWEERLTQDTVMERALHMLAAFQLRVPLSQRHSQALSEMAELRNVLLHNGGEVDERFLDKCPWRTERLGAMLQVSEAAMGLYFDATSAFANGLVDQACKSPNFRTKAA